MPGRIRKEDIDAVRERVRIDEVVGEHVTLKSAGLGSLKGLCPFHDERTPSFQVRPQVGFYHCFGCGEGGDVIKFLMTLEHLSFVETVERLAARVGFQLTYEEGTGPDRAETGRRQRLLDANAAAEVFFREQLTSPEAVTGRAFLHERGFDQAAAQQFGVGYAPKGWGALQAHLRGRGFRDDELVTAGLLSTGNRGAYDRFRGRLIWPIRDITGATVGFGARKLYDDDQGPKYLNTPQTPVYNKSAVLYGIDLAKREIAKAKQVVVVEGYTDVMAMHLSGVPTAVATCGTAFGADHIKIVRRLLVDDDAFTGEVVFTFDGDAAGQKAALRAFQEDQRFVAQTFVAVESSGMDPCELRVAKGPDAVQALVRGREPLFEFAIRSSLKQFDLDHVEGRVQGLRAAAPVVAQIRDHSLRPEYARRLAGWLGMDVDEVRRQVAAAVSRAGKDGGQPDRRDALRDDRRDDRPEDRDAGGPPPQTGPPPLPAPDLRDPAVVAERQLLQVLLQYPGDVDAEQVAAIEGVAFTAPAHRVLFDAVRACGGPQAAGSDWASVLSEAVPDSLRPLVGQLLVAPLPVSKPEQVRVVASGLVKDARKRELLRAKADLYSRLQRAEAGGDAATMAEVNAQLMELQRTEHELRTS
ncbi:DNA primase [Angustibacter speluncae]